MDSKNVKEKLKQGQVTLGTWMQLPYPSVAEILGNAGYDWVAVDVEHGHFSKQILPDLFRALELHSTVPFARLAVSSPQDTKIALDAGARGIILPNIIDAETLKHCIQSAYYPPKGNRGVGYSRANLFGKNFNSYAECHVQEITVVAQIENIKAVENIDAILTQEDLDAIIIGPYDLSGSMGITAAFDDPKYLQVIDTILRKTKEHGIPMGMHIVLPNTEQLEAKIRQGYQFIAYGTDAVFLYHNASNPLKK